MDSIKENFDICILVNEIADMIQDAEYANKTINYDADSLESAKKILFSVLKNKYNVNPQHITYLNAQIKCLTIK